MLKIKKKKNGNFSMHISEPSNLSYEFLVNHSNYSFPLQKKI